MSIPRSWRPFVPWLIVVFGSLIFLAIAEKPWADGLDTTREVKSSIRTHSWAVIGLWYGAVINLALAIAVMGFLYLTRNSKRKTTPSLPDLSRREHWRREIIFLRLIVVAIALFGAWMMFPRLSLSLWGDEQATASRYVIGNVYRVGEDEDEFILKAPRWEKTLFNWDSGPSNQVLFSVMARLAHGPGDVSPDDPKAYYFSEWKIRLPSYLAGIGAVLATCWLVWLLGAPYGAPIAAFLMIMHPLVLRYSTEARGYALLLFFGPLAVCFLIKALQTTRLRWWIPFGIVQFLLLWSYFGSVYLLVPLNVVAIWLAWDFKENRNPLRSGQLRRWAGATLLGAMLTLQFMLPNLLQLPAFLEGGRLEGTIDGRWVQDSLSFWISGMPWHKWELENPNSLTLQEICSKYAGIVIFFSTVFIFSAGLGLQILMKTRARAIALILIFPAILMVLHAKMAGNLLYPWYTVGFIPLGIVLVARGLAAIPFGNLSKSKVKQWLYYTFFVVCLIAGVSWQYWTHFQRQNVRYKSVEPLAESTRHYREVVNPFHPEIDSVKSIAFHFYSRLYDPAAEIAKSDDEFIAILKKADEADNSGTDLTSPPIWVNTAHIPFGKVFFPKAFELLEDPEVFEESVVYWGMQQPCTRHVFKYKPGGLARHAAVVE